MKKILLFIISLVVLIPCVVLADMGAPMVRPYEAEVTNPNGAVIYENSNNQYTPTSKKIDYGQTLTVDMEEAGYIWVSLDEDNISGFISIKDVTVTDDSLKDIWLGEKVDGLVLVDSEIKKGPSDAYKSTGDTITAGTKVTVRMINDTSTPWVYIEYNGKKGYANSYEGAIVYKWEESKEYLIPYEREIRTLVKDGYSEANIVGKIPSYTIVKDPYFTDGWSYSMYIDYNGKKGFIYNMAAIKNSGNYKLIKNSDIHESIESDSKVIGKLDAGYIFKDPFIYEDHGECAVFYESEDKKIKGWITYLWDEENEPIKKIDDQGNVVEESTTTKVTNNKEKDKEIKLSKKDYVIMCVIVATSVSLTAIVTSILINKKNKKAVSNEEIKNKKKETESNK